MKYALRYCAIALAIIVGATNAIAKQEEACNADWFPYLTDSIAQIYLKTADHSGDEPNRRGTVVFRADDVIATVDHVVDGIDRSKDFNIELALGGSVNQEAVIRYSRLATFVAEIEQGGAEPIVVLQLDQPIPGRVIPKIAYNPVKRNESVFAIGFTRGHLRYAHGRFAPPEPNPNAEPSNEAPNPYLPFEFWDADKKENDRYVLDKGASGSPVFNCRGELVALVSAFLVVEHQKINNLAMLMQRFFPTMMPEMRLTARRGQANIHAVPASGIPDYIQR